VTCGCDETGYGYFVKAAITGCTQRGNLEAKGELIILPPLIARPCGWAVHTGYPWVANTVIHRLCGKTFCCLIVVSPVVENVIETITRRFQGVVNAKVAKRTFGFGDNSRLTRCLHAYSRQIRAVHFVVDVWLHNKSMAKAPHFS